MVSALFLILRILTVASFLHDHKLLWLSSALQGVLFLCASGFCAVTRPYKLNFKANIDNLILILLVIRSLTFTVPTNYPADKHFTNIILHTQKSYCC